MLELSDFQPTIFGIGIVCIYINVCIHVYNIDVLEFRASQRWAPKGGPDKGAHVKGGPAKI